MQHKRVKKFLSRVLVCILGVAMYSYINANTIVRTNYEIKSNKVDRRYRVVFISDIHYGVAQSEKSVHLMCEEISDLKPDVLLIGGDVLENEKQTVAEMRAIFAALGTIRTEYGIFWVSGNHDTYPYVGPSLYSTQDLLRALDDNHIINLVDKCIDVDGLTLVGRGDRVTYAGRQRPKASDILTEPSSNFTILLDHDPNTGEIEDIDYDLKLSGHTHAGQVFPGNFYFAYTDKYRYGEYVHNGKPLIVSSGVGVGRAPFRNLKHCEYVVLTIDPE